MEQILGILGEHMVYPFTVEQFLITCSDGFEMAFQSVWLLGMGWYCLVLDFLEQKINKEKVQARVEYELYICSYF